MQPTPFAHTGLMSSQFSMLRTNQVAGRWACMTPNWRVLTGKRKCSLVGSLHRRLGRPSGCGGLCGLTRLKPCPWNRRPRCPPRDVAVEFQPAGRVVLNDDEGRLAGGRAHWEKLAPIPRPSGRTIGTGQFVSLRMTLRGQGFSGWSVSCAGKMPTPFTNGLKAVVFDTLGQTFDRHSVEIGEWRLVTARA